MISFLLRKMRKNKWIMLSLLIGNVLLIGIVSGTPIYIQGSMQRILIRDMEQSQLDHNIHPAIVELGFTFESVSEEASVATYERIRRETVPYIVNLLNIPAIRIVENLRINDIRVVPAEPRAENPRTQAISLNTFAGFEDHITITHGRLPSNELQEGNIIEGIINHRTMAQRDLLIGELLTITNIVYEVEREDSDEEEEVDNSLFGFWNRDYTAIDNAYYLRIVGVFEAETTDELFWTTNPNTFSRDVLVSHDLVRNHFVANYDPQHRLSAHWIIMLDYYGMSMYDVPEYLLADRSIRRGMTLVRDEILTYEENFISTLQGYVERTDRLTTTLLVLQVPIYVFLAFYIFIISRQILRLEQNDISILKSRGTRRGKIILIYLIQSIFVSGLSLALGIPLGIMVCRFLGASNGFMELVVRAAITTDLNRYVFIYSGIAAVGSILMMLVPVIGFSKITIVEHKRSSSRRLKKPLWQRFFLDILFLGISVYGYYNFNSRREIMALAVVDVQTMDPLLFISSSLFIIGLGLLCLRLYPYLMRFVAFIGNRLWSPASYASLLKVIRFSNDEQFIMIFLVFTLSLGVFSATTARTLNTNDEHMIQYQIGTDLVFAERFRDNIPPPMPGAEVEMPDRIIYTEPDFERFTGFEEVDALTRVMIHRIDIRRERSVIENVTMMAIDTESFGETIWYRDDILPIHINFFLNALALREDGVLLSENFRVRYGYEVGEHISFTDTYGNRANGMIVGFIERWPTYSDRVRVMDAGGAYVFQESFLVVSNLGHIHSIWGMYPYQVWMRTNTSSNRFFYEFAVENHLDLIFFEDASAEVVNSRNNPILQGTNGVLTASFIFTFLACFTGYLIYWTLSIKSRALQFGVFHAMGMTKKNLLRMLFYEQIFISLSAIGIGVLVGIVAARLFVPLIQVAYSPSLQPIPLMIITEVRDYINIFSVIGVMFIICIFILGTLISKLKIAQALKLGED